MIFISKDELEQFDRPFSELLDEMAEGIDPGESRHFTRKGLGKILDLGILIRRGFQEAWQFVVLIQTLFIFLGLSPQVSQALKQLGISISGTTIGVLAVFGIVFLFIFGLVLLLYGGTHRSNSLISEKQNPAQRMNYYFYRGMARWARNADRRLEKIEKKLEKLEK